MFPRIELKLSACICIIHIFLGLALTYLSNVISHSIAVKEGHIFSAMCKFSWTFLVCFVQFEFQVYLEKSACIFSLVPGHLVSPFSIWFRNSRPWSSSFILRIVKLVLPSLSSIWKNEVEMIFMCCLYKFQIDCFLIFRLQSQNFKKIKIKIIFSFK